MATEEHLERLGRCRAPRPTSYFVELMRAHHHGGIHMAEYAAEHAESEAGARRWRRRWRAAKQDEIAEMERELGQLTALPAVGRPDRSTDRSYTPDRCRPRRDVPPRPGRGARTHARLHVRVC